MKWGEGGAGPTGRGRERCPCEDKIEKIVQAFQKGRRGEAVLGET